MYVIYLYDILVGREGANGYAVNATYAAVEQAQQAIKQLNNYEFHNSELKVINTYHLHSFLNLPWHVKPVQ